jgi:hypothetical protein
MVQGNIEGVFENQPEQQLESLKVRIRMVFKNHQHQTKVINQLYRMFITGWDRVDYIQGHPHCGEDLWKFICGLFLEFDREHHPDSQPGGIWSSWGFIMNTTLGPWEVSLEYSTLNYHQERRHYGRHSKS